MGGGQTDLQMVGKVEVVDRENGSGEGMGWGRQGGVEGGHLSKEGSGCEEVFG